MENENENENDILGLDQPLKLGRVLRIPKLTDELLFENNRGLPQVRNNYNKLLRAMKKNDKAYAAKVVKQKLSKSGAQQLKVSTEVENLQKVLLFYQLWCHGLFPRATFKDCVKMIRGHKSVALKEYRRGLISNEIRRLKIEKGIIVEDPENDGEDEIDEALYAPPGTDIGVSSELPMGGTAAVNEDGDGPADEDDDEDGWGFMSKNWRGNGLFVDDDDSEDENGNIGVGQDRTHFNDKENDDEAPAKNVSTKDAFDYLDDFDDFNYFNALEEHTNVSQAEQDHDEELAVMHEMGM